MQKFYAADAPDLGSAPDWLKQISHPARLIRSIHYPDLDSDTSSVWNFCARFSDDISRENQLWRSEISAVFSGEMTVRPGPQCII